MSTTPTSAGVRNGGGKYTVVRRIGLNGSSELFLGRSAGGTGEQVVIKRLSPAAAQREEEVARFTNEARVAMALRHPNIIPAVDFGQDEAGWYLVLSAVQGQALRRVIDAHGKPFPLPQAFAIILEVSRALIHAHQVPDPRGAPGILHRGISPVTILMGVDGVTRLLDFGLERPAPRADDDPRRVRYLSPEQACGAPLDPRSDVYSLGAVLFELTTGRPLFSSTSTPELLRSIVDGEILAPTSVMPDYPLDLEELVVRALARDPAARFDHAGDLAASLEVFLVRNELTSTTEQMAAWVKPLLGAPRTPPESPKGAPVNGGAATVRAEASAALKLAQEKQAAARREIDARKAQKAAAEVTARTGEAVGDTVPSFQIPEEMASSVEQLSPETVASDQPPLVVGNATEVEIEVEVVPPKSGAFAAPPASPELETQAAIPLPASDTEPGVILPARARANTPANAPAELRKQLQAAVEREAAAARRAQEATERTAGLEKERAELQGKVSELERRLTEESQRASSPSGAADSEAARAQAAQKDDEAAVLEAQLRGEAEAANAALEKVRAEAQAAREESQQYQQRADAAEALLEAARRELNDRDAGQEKRNDAKEKETAARIQAEVSKVEAGALRLVEAAKRETEQARAEAATLKAELERVTAEAAEATRKAEETAAALEAAAREALEARTSAEAASADAAAKSESESAAGARAQAAIADAERARAEAKAARKDAAAAKKNAEGLLKAAREAEEARVAAEQAMQAAEDRRRELEVAEGEDAAKRKAEVAAAMQVVRTAMEQANEAQQDADAARAAAEEARVASEAAKAEADEALSQAAATRAEADRVLAEAAEIRSRADAVARAAAATRREANTAKADAERAVREAEEKRTSAMQIAEQIRVSSEAREVSARRAEQASFEMVQAAAHSKDAAMQEAELARNDAAAARAEAAAARAEVEGLKREASAAQALANAAILEAEATLERIEAVRRDVLLDTEIAELQTEEARWAAHAERMKALLADAPTGDELDGAFDGLIVDGPTDYDANAEFDDPTFADPPATEPTQELVDESVDGAVTTNEEPVVDEGATIDEGLAADGGEVVAEDPAAGPLPADEPVSEGSLGTVDVEEGETTADEAIVEQGTGFADQTVPDWTESTPMDSPASDDAGAAPVALAGRTNLAADDTPFVGRDELLASLDQRLDSGERLMILFGQPGSGRSRVARQLGARHLLQLSKLGGVWYVPLEHARTAPDVCRAMARALSLRLSDDAAAADAQIAASLAARKRILIVLDDVDGASAALPALVGGWLAAAEESAFVLVAETPDVVPESATIEIGMLSTEGGAASEAARFVQTLHDRVHPGESLDGAGASTVASLLSGCALAAELAVGSGLEPKKLAKELAPKLKTTSPGEILQRVLEWRWSRLNGWEKICFAHASVFEGSFASDAAAAVIDLSAHPKAPPMDQILESLRVGGLVREAGAGRWDFHPTVGAFAATKLPASPRAKVSARRDAFVTALASALAPFAEARSAEALDRLSEERVQLVACLRRSLDESSQNATNALALLRALGPLFERDGLADEIGVWADTAIAAAEAANIQDASLASLLRLRAGFRHARGDTNDAMAELEAAEAMAVAANDTGLIAQIRIDQGRVLASDPERRKKARAKLDEALAAAESTSDLRLQACVLAEIGALGRFAGLDAVAKDAYERGLACAEKAGDRALECELRVRFGRLLAESGNRAAARAHLGTAVSFATELADRSTAAKAAHLLGLLALEEGFSEPAEERFRMAIEIWAEIGERHDEAVAWGDLAIALDLQGRHEDSRRSRAWSMSVLAELEDRVAESIQRAYLATTDAVEGNAEASREAFAVAKRNAGKGPEGDVVELLQLCAEVALAKAEGNVAVMRQKRAAAALKIAARNANEPLGMRIARRIASRALDPD